MHCVTVKIEDGLGEPMNLKPWKVFELARLLGPSAVTEDGGSPVYEHPSAYWRRHSD